ncbi:hypothetical protein [Leptospira haakeii]|uniref:Uncharacterized protein n=1 Tax=Leptospira haakeii TaxID=2023198 RepID=A0ABX4PF01_9LEPT|nr:hypothetical protein [Leptospira haakeii]PKA14330.1 hypothetical protein CH363_19215 [Leptospira haakeii]PKA18188.1 hypothetical protein CH377_18970 [Leptospira haakeii]
MQLIEIIQSGQFVIIESSIVIAADGGTIAFTLMDSQENEHPFYLDRRIESKTRNHFYVNAYPGFADALYIGENLTLLAAVEKVIVQN